MSSLHFAFAAGRPSWDETWLAVADVLRLRSKCQRGVGAVVIDSKNQIQASGYTGPPASWRHASDANDCLAYCPRAGKLPRDRLAGYSDCASIHAEINCLLRADRTRIGGGAFYVSSVPCLACAKAIANSGVHKVFWRRNLALEAGRDVGGVTDLFTDCKLYWAMFE
jgi:dCMP deaminase